MIERTRLILGISVFWLALSMLSDGLNVLILPYYLFGISDEGSRATILGLITFVGLVFGMLVQPIAGAASDRWLPRWGRRGTIGLGVLALLVSLAVFGFSRNIVLVFLGYLLLQGSMNLAQAAQQGFIPDLIPLHLRGRAAGMKGLMDVGGAFLGFLLLGQLLGEGETGLPLLILAVMLVITFLITAVLVREPAQPSSARRNPMALADAFKLNLGEHRTFVWLVVSRFLFLLGTYAVGRFLLYFVADRLHLAPDPAAEEAGNLLAILTLVTALGAPLTGWAADRFGRMPLMVLGAVLSGVGVFLMIVAIDSIQILLFGGLMALGSAAFAGANWAMTADYVPLNEAARFMALANFGTAGAAAAAGLLGPLVDWANSISFGTGYSLLFTAAALMFVASALALRKISVEATMAAT